MTSKDELMKELFDAKFPMIETVSGDMKFTLYDHIADFILARDRHLADENKRLRGIVERAKVSLRTIPVCAENGEPDFDGLVNAVVSALEILSESEAS